MKIQLNGIIKDYSAQEVKELLQQGHRFQHSKKLGVYVPAPIQIHENGRFRDTGMDELVRRKAAGEKFLKASERAIYAPVDAEQYSAVMRPIWREDKRESVGSTVSMKENPAAPTAAVMDAHIPCIGQSPWSVRWNSTIPRFPFTRMSPRPHHARSVVAGCTMLSPNSIPSTMKFLSAGRRDSRSAPLLTLSASNLKKASVSV